MKLASFFLAGVLAFAATLAEAAEIGTMSIDHVNGIYQVGERAHATLEMFSVPTDSDFKVEVESTLVTPAGTKPVAFKRFAQTWRYTSPVLVAGSSSLSVRVYFTRISTSVRNLVFQKIVHMTVQGPGPVDPEEPEEPEEPLPVVIETDEPSPGSIVFSGIDPTAFNSVESRLAFSVSGATANPESTLVRWNGVILRNSDLLVGASLFQINFAPISGVNTVSVTAADSNGKILHSTITFVAGDRLLSVFNAARYNTYRLEVVDFPGISMDGTPDSFKDISRFNNVPASAVRIYDTSRKYEQYILSGAEGSTSLISYGGINAAPKNLKFELGSLGWSGSGSIIDLIEHKNDIWNQPSIFAKRGKGRAGTRLIRKTVDPSSCSSIKCDLLIYPNTNDFGRVGHRFSTTANRLTIKYRISSPEIELGSNLEQYNDVVLIGVRDSLNNVQLHSDSLIQLGTETFSENGHTDWRTKTFDIQTSGEVEVFFNVANVRDGVAPTLLVVSEITEDSEKLESTNLSSVDGVHIQGLSVGPSPYNDANALAVNTVIRGIETSSVDSVKLLLYSKQRFEIAPAGIPSDLGLPFGAGGAKQVGLNFNLPSGVASDAIYNRSSLALSIRMSSGFEIIHPLGVFDNFSSLSSIPSRSGSDRNLLVGGDDWITKELSGAFSAAVAYHNLKFDDISRSHGGVFLGHVESNMSGSDVDVRGWYLPTSGNTGAQIDSATRIIQILNDPSVGPLIGKILASDADYPSSPFWQEVIADPDAKDKVMPFPNRDHRFTIRFDRK